MQSFLWKHHLFLDALAQKEGMMQISTPILCHKEYHCHTTVILPKLCKSSCSVFFAYTLTANIQTNPQHYIYTCQQGAFPFHTAAHKHIEKGKERIHTFSSLLIADDRTRVFGYSPVPQAYCSLFNLRKRIPFHFVLGLD